MGRPPRQRLIALAIAAAAIAACDTGDGKTLREPTGTVAPTTVPTLNSVPLESSALPTLPADELAEPVPFQVFTPWIEGGPIDALYSCDGEDVSPAVSWASPPAGTAELAVAMVDDSAVDDDGPFVHWVIAGIDPAAISLTEGEVPLGVVQAVNSFGTVGYRGPCPPVGDEAHRYRLTLYALNQQVELADGIPADDLLGLIEEVAIGAVGVIGTYRR